MNVAVLGTGRMGSAIATALLARGHAVAVWNRTPQRTDALVERGARRALSPADALTSADVALVAMIDYAAGEQVLRSPAVEAAVRGRTVIQLTSGTPAEAVAHGRWAAEHGASYLEGYPMCYETEIGTPGAVSVYAGPRAVFEASRGLLETLGEAVHIGEDPALCNAALMGSIPLYHGAILGFLQGAAVAEANGLGAAAFRDLMVRFLRPLGSMISETGDRLAGSAPLTPGHATVANQLAVSRSLVDACRAASVSAELPEHFAEWFARAARRGLDEHDVAAMVALLRRGDEG